MPSKPTVRERLGLKQRGPLRMIPLADGGERRLTAAEVRAMKLARADIIGARADEAKEERRLTKTANVGQTQLSDGESS